MTERTTEGLEICGTCNRPVLPVCNHCKTTNGEGDEDSVCHRCCGRRQTCQDVEDGVVAREAGEHGMEMGAEFATLALLGASVQGVGNLRRNGERLFGWWQEWGHGGVRVELTRDQFVEAARLISEKCARGISHQTGIMAKLRELLKGLE